MSIIINFPENLTSQQKTKIVRVFFVFCCLLGFCLNSYLIFDDYIEANTVISTDIKSAENNMLLSPSILVCGKTSFKDTKLNTKLSDYLNNTLKLNEVLEFAAVIKHKPANLPVIHVKDQFRSFYTIYYGACYMLDLQIMVRSK